MSKICIRGILGFIGALVIWGSAVEVWAEEDHPSRPIEFVVPWGAGGGADQLARQTAKMLEQEMKAVFSVVNVPGASGNKGIARLLASPPDGYTIAVLTADTSTPHAYVNKTSWVLDDVIPVAIMMQQSSALLVREGSRFKTWADLEKEARANPGSVKVAVTGLGSPDYVTLEYLASQGIKLTPLPYSNPAERYESLLLGSTDALYEQLGDVKDFIARKEMNPIIMFSQLRSREFTNVPSSKELGFDVTLSQFRALVVKKGTDPRQVGALATAIGKVATSAEYKSFLKAHYAEQNGWVSGADASHFIQEHLSAAKKIVATIHWHGQYLNQAQEVETYVEPF
jgi:tripartite-type tricarboxylate transporter receptor subunit TctC